MESTEPTVSPTAPASPCMPAGSAGHEYNTRLWAPDFAATLERLALLGDPVRHRPGAQLDLAWGAGSRQLLDVFLPHCARGPLVVHIHGGYWQYRSSGKDGGSFLAPTFTDRGVAFVALQYELCPDVDMDGMVEQLRQAVGWIHHHLPALGFVAHRMIVTGHSAGAHLAAMLALTDWPSRGLPTNLVAGICGISGLYDLSPLVSTYVNEALRLVPESAERNSPMNLLRRGCPPMLLAVGGRESPSFKLQTTKFAAAGALAGISVDPFELEGLDHYTAIEALAQEDHPLQRALLAMLA